MKRSAILIVIALLIIGPRESAAQISESDCYTILPSATDPGGGFCGLQFWQPDLQKCFSTLKPYGTLCTPAGSPCEKPSVCQLHGSFQDLKMSCSPVGLPQHKSRVCRPSTGVCDQDDYCDGTSLDCTTDLAAPDTTLCRPSVGACDVSDFCDGVTRTCRDEVAAEGETCRSTEDQCNLDESCDGISAFCPEDELGEGMECDDGDECTDEDECTQGQCVGNGIDSCSAEEPDAGPGDETPDTGTSPGDDDAGPLGESDAEEDSESDGGGCSVATQSSHAGWLLVFMAAFVWTRRRKLTPIRSASMN